MSETRDSYVYVYFRLTGLPCYVGKGYGRRYKRHLDRTSNIHLRRIIDQATRAGRELPVVLVREGLTDAEAMETEVAMILAIGRCDLGTGTLVNMTAGGDGIRDPSVETREKIGRAMRGASHTEAAKTRMRAAHAKLGRRLSAETRTKMSVAKTGKMTEAHKEAIRQARLGVPRSEETRARISASRTGKKYAPHSAETRAKISATQKGRSKGPMSDEHRAAIGAGLLGSRRGEETKARMRAALEIRRQRSRQPMNEEH